VETPWDKDRGTRVEIEMEATYKKGRRSVDDYIEQTALANPHITLRYVAPKEDIRVFPRVADELPVESKEIKPHPYGIELGILLRMMKDTASRTVSGMLSTDFSRVSAAVAEQICRAAGVRADADPRRLSTAQAELLFRAIPTIKIMAPPTACLSPIGE